MRADKDERAGRRPLRASAERLFELARHLTERDREVALYLYRHRVLTTEQLQLLFFSSRRRAQDRLLFLYRNRVLDRFYPSAPFGSGKPDAHWLLDEAGALLVAASLNVERKQLGWQRRDDWGSHPQLAHQLETNRFVTDLVAATLANPNLGVGEWWPPAQAADRVSPRGHRRVLPDAGFRLQILAGPIECYLEWDRATETQKRLADKLRAYRRAEGRLYHEGNEPRCILFVVPGKRRLETLRLAYGDFERQWEVRASRGSFEGPTGRWPLLATTAVRLRKEGSLAPVWNLLDVETAPPLALTDLPARGDFELSDPSMSLGRRWRKDDPDFWRRLSPLGMRALGASDEHALQTRPPTDPEAEVVAERLRDLRQANREETRRDVAPLGDADPIPNLRPSAIDGSMDARDNDLEEERWR
jgi:hypothetical protein